MIIRTMILSIRIIRTIILSIINLIETLSIINLRMIILSIMTLRITIFRIIGLITTLCLKTFTTECYYAECRVFTVMLSVAFLP